MCVYVCMYVCVCVLPIHIFSAFLACPSLLYFSYHVTNIFLIYQQIQRPPVPKFCRGTRMHPYNNKTFIWKPKHPQLSYQRRYTFLVIICIYLQKSYLIFFTYLVRLVDGKEKETLPVEVTLPATKPKTSFLSFNSIRASMASSFGKLISQTKVIFWGTLRVFGRTNLSIVLMRQILYYAITDTYIITSLPPHLWCH